MSPQRRRDRGQALTEFALVAPIFFLLFFGIIDVGRYVYVANALNQAVREGARVGSVIGWSESCPTAANRSVCVEETVLGRIAGGTAGLAVTSSCWRQVGTGPITVSADQCRGGDLLTVTVSAPYEMFTPLVAQLIDPLSVTGSAQMAVNN